MKIIDTSCFEKLKIRPVNAKNLDTGFTYRRLSDSEFNALDINNLEDGWIFVTKRFRVWIKMKNEMCLDFFKTYRFSFGDAFVSVSPDTESGVCYIPFDTYYHFPFNMCEEHTVVAAYKTNIDISKFITPADFTSFYHKYDINETIYKDYKNENI